jgi:hypothetical protein
MYADTLVILGTNSCSACVCAMRRQESDRKNRAHLSTSGSSASRPCPAAGEVRVRFRMAQGAAVGPVAACTDSLTPPPAPTSTDALHADRSTVERVHSRYCGVARCHAHACVGMPPVTSHAHLRVGMAPRTLFGGAQKRECTPVERST